MISHASISTAAAGNDCISRLTPSVIGNDDNNENDEEQRNKFYNFLNPPRSDLFVLFKDN